MKLDSVPQKVPSRPRKDHEQSMVAEPVREKWETVRPFQQLSRRRLVIVCRPYDQNVEFWQRIGDYGRRNSERGRAKGRANCQRGHEL
jgi:hypothetical protein